MLKFYHNSLSPNSRRVWVALLEKNIPFEVVQLNLDGDQFQPEFLAINPFHHIPVLVDDDFKVVESLAILDYLEAKYPTPAMLPIDATLATVRIVEMVTINVVPAITPLLRQMMGFRGGDPQQLEQSKQKAGTVLTFFENLLGEHPYFGDDRITLAEVVAGTTVPMLPTTGVPLDDYPKLSAWCDRLLQRSAWQTTEPSPEAIAAIKSRLEALI